MNPLGNPAHPPRSPQPGPAYPSGQARPPVPAVSVTAPPPASAHVGSAAQPPYPFPATPPFPAAPGPFSPARAPCSPVPHRPDFAGLADTFGMPYTPGLHLPRPDSPTFRELQDRCLLEDVTGWSVGPDLPAGRKEMTQGEAAAFSLFRHNMNVMDPTGNLRTTGEFLQAYAKVGDNMIVTTPVHYRAGTSVNFPTALPEGTTHVIHSHPVSTPGFVWDFPSAVDYREAYLASKVNDTIEGEILHIPMGDRALGYQGKLNPHTGAPEFHELVNPFDMGHPANPGELLLMRPLPDPGTYGQHFIDWPVTPRPEP